MYVKSVLLVKFKKLSVWGGLEYCPLYSGRHLLPSPLLKTVEGIFKYAGTPSKIALEFVCNKAVLCLFAKLKNPSLVIKLALF